MVEPGQRVEALSDIKMVGAEHLFPDGQSALARQLSLGVTSLPIEGDGLPIKRGRLRELIGALGRFVSEGGPCAYPTRAGTRARQSSSRIVCDIPNPRSASKERLSLGAPPLCLVQPGQFSEALGDIGMIGAKCILADCQGAFIKFLGFLSALTLINRG